MKRILFGCLIIAASLLMLWQNGASANGKKRLRHHGKTTARQVSKQPPSSGKTAPKLMPTELIESLEKRTKFEEDPAARKRWFMFQRSYPFKSIPENARQSAFASINKKGIKPLVAQSWQSIGPAPTSSFFIDNWGVTSGRINTIAISPKNPDLILLGAATGGIWRSTDGGATFIPTTDSQADLAVGSITFSKSNPTVIYAGMGDPQSDSYLGTGVLKSTDEGQTWTRINNSSLPSTGIISKVEIDPNSPDRVYVAQFAELFNNEFFSSGFYLSTDGGVNWKETLKGLPTDLVINPANSMTLYLGMARVDQGNNMPAGLYKSTDGGNTWKNLYSTPYEANLTFDVRVAVTPANAQTIYIYTGGIIGDSFDVRVVASNDGGNSFTNLGSSGIDTGQFGYNSYIYADPANANTIYVGTRDVYKSTDGGNTYVNLTKDFMLDGEYNPEQSSTHPDQHAFTFAPAGSNQIYVGNDGGISLSTDAGNTFKSLNSSLTLTQYTSLALHPTDATISYGGTQDNGTQRRVMGTSKWQEFVTGDGGQCVIDAADPTTVFTTYIYGNIFRLTQNGDNFDQQVADSTTFGESDSSPRINFYAPFTGNGVDQTLYFGSYRLFVSTDLGNTWTPPAGTLDLTSGNNDVLNVIAVSHSDTNVIYTGSNFGRAMISRDGGKTYTDITRGLPNRTITSITVDRSNAGTAYLTVSGFGSGHVFKTTNSGASWQDISDNLPNIPCDSLLIDPINASKIYLGTDIGVFLSTTGGGQWQAFNQGLPPVIVMAFAAQSTGLVELASYGRGAYQLLGSAPGDFTISVMPDTQAVDIGAAASFTINAASMNGFGDPINLTASSSESSLKFNFSSNQLMVGSSSTLMVSTAANTMPGDYNITITGNSGSITKTVTVTLTVNGPDFSFSVDNSTITAKRGGQGKINVTVARMGGLTGTVTITSPDAKLVRIKLKPPTLSVTDTTGTFVYKVNPRAFPGTFPVTLVGTDSMGHTHSVPLEFIVQ